jgi:signal transduction histidine kinase/ligand-binding sensor domain-containing protein
MIWFRLIAVALLSIFFSARMEGQVLPFVHFTPDSEVNPLPSAEAQHVFQDDSGFIWFTVFSSGLMRYDGRRKTLFTLRDGLKDLALRGIIQDNQGRLWVSSNAGLVASGKPLSLYDLDEDPSFIHELQNVVLSDVAITRQRIASDQSGNIWAGLAEGALVRLSISADDVFMADTILLARPDIGAMPSIQSVYVRNDQTVWAGLSTGDLVMYDGEMIRWMVTGKADAGQSIEVLYEDPDGVLWGGSRNGQLWWYNEQSQKTEPIRNLASPLSGITDITASLDGSLWVSTAGNGVIRLNRAQKNHIRYYTRINGLLSDVVTGITVDRENNIWFSQSGGVSKLRYNFDAFENFTSVSYAGERPVLPSPTVGAILPGNSATEPCRIWAGTSGGGLACIGYDGNSEHIRQENGLSFDWVNGLSHDHKGRLWIGTTRGINSISVNRNAAAPGASAHSSINLYGNSFTLSAYPSVGIAAVVPLQMPERPGQPPGIPSIWFPGVRALYALVDDQFYELGSTAGLPSTILHAVAYDNNGHLWVGTRDSGIYRSTRPVTRLELEAIKNNELLDDLFEPFWTVADGAPGNQIETLKWHNGAMWVGTPSGLIVLDPETAVTLHYINSVNGFLADNAASIALSPVSGLMWVGTNGGLAEVDPRDGSVVRTITRQDGLIDNEVWFYGSVKAGPDGTVYFGTSRGVAVYHPDLDNPNLVPPKLFLHSARVSREAGDRNELTLEYAALSFGNERQVRFRTRLVGYNDQWTDEKADVTLRYTNLPAIFRSKKYTFEVMAVNESGVWSEAPLQHSILIAPPWWFKWWAFMIYLLAISATVFTVDRIQRARLIKKEREQARLREAELRAETADARSKAAEAQTRVLEVENERKALELEKAKELEKAYYELKEAQDQLIQSEKMASLGRMSAGIAHEIKNPLNFVNNFAALSKDLVADLKTAIEENDAEEIEYIVSSLSANTQKIEEHGKRADSIVRSMMQHARGGQGSKEPTDLNALVTENVNLAYHGKRAQINNFNAEIQLDLEPGIGQITLVPQDVGRVILNIIGNAFDAVWEHYGKTGDGYNPEIRISTRKIEGDMVEIRIADNGPGIPENIRERIFEPFFTTKPTGVGTGLGLSLSYDIIAQGHGGVLKAENTSTGAEFIIRLPVR